MSTTDRSQPASLDQILTVVLAVAGGATTPAAIADATGSTAAQVRFLRNIAIALGLLAISSDGQAQVTSRAARMLGAKDRVQRIAKLRYAVRQLPAAARALAYLQEHPLGCTIRKLEAVIGEERPPVDVPVEWYARTIIALLKELELISEQNGVVRAVDALARR